MRSPKLGPALFGRPANVNVGIILALFILYPKRVSVVTCDPTAGESRIQLLLPPADDNQRVW